MSAETAPASNQENWNPSIFTSLLRSELKGDTSQVETNPPEKVFDNFEITRNTAPSPTVTTLSPTSGAASGGRSVTLIVSTGTSATNLTVVSSMKGVVCIASRFSYDRLRNYRGRLEGRQ
ncbi:MAG TPA: hypothetical protein VKB05_02840 [Pyrinomonadaceae bacterium]|nr:hypothetical protein [Pyrinomonadaceae bacterium]